MMRMLSAALVAASMLPAVPAFAQAPATPTYLMKAGASDLYERQASQLVLQSTKNPRLKTFANEMVRDHAKSTADVKAAAMKANVKVTPPRLDADQTKMIAALRGASGTARDTLYIRQQKTAHAQALQLQRSYAESGATPALKTVAGNIVPVVKHHIAMLDAM